MVERDHLVEDRPQPQPQPLQTLTQVENDCLLEDGTVDWAAFASCAWYVALYIAQDQDVYGLD